MSRLVDADELIKNIKSYTGVFNNTGYYTRNDLIVKAINKTPTAYDVEAVVRELETKSELYSCEAEADMDNGWEYLSNRKYGISAGLQKAIEIVRGGRNE